MYFTIIKWSKIKIGTYFRWSASMMRGMSYSACKMGAYEPIKYQLGATDRHHTALHLKLAAGASSGNIQCASIFY